MGVISKKILFIVTQSEFGGAQRYIYEISRALSPERYEILVAAGEGNGELFEKISKLKNQKSNLRFKSQNLKYLKRAPNPWQACLSVREIYNLLKKEKPDVLFLCSTTAGLLGSIAGFLYKKLEIGNWKLEIIYRIGGWAFRDPRPAWQNKIIFWLEKLTARFKDVIIVNSEYDWRIAVENKIISPEKIIKIYNGLNVDSLEFLPREVARKQLFQFNNLTIVGCVANFYKTKGLAYLIEAAKIISINQPNQHKSVFLIIGEGRQRPELEALIKKHNLQNMVFLPGRIADSYKYLKAFDVFVLPSLKEGFPWIILEAMAAEVPIIATRVGALPEIIEDKKNGFLVEPKNPQIIARKIAWLLENPKRARNAGIQARKKAAREFPIEKMVKETEKVLAYS